MCFFVYMTIQHLLLKTELSQFSKMIQDVQKQNFDLENGKWIPFVGGYLLLYGTIIQLLNYFILTKNESLTNAFLLGCGIYIISDITMFTLFEGARSHIFLFIYDILIVGGGCFLATTYLFRNYSLIIKKYTWLFVLSYLFMALSPFTF